ncbi:hypothetical protein H4R19_001054 [Coemansia spiralis]|nr:hypothetical protein H4R19_001054 [Coemansia spiralis]
MSASGVWVIVGQRNASQDEVAEDVFWGQDVCRSAEDGSGFGEQIHSAFLNVLLEK